MHSVYCQLCVSFLSLLIIGRWCRVVAWRAAAWSSRYGKPASRLNVTICAWFRPIKKSMKILFTNFHPGIGGGHVTYIESLLLGLKATHSLFVACPATSRLFIRASEIVGIQAIDMSFTTRPSSWFAARSALRELLLKEKFDVIHVNGSSDHKQVMLALIGLGCSPRVVFTKHNGRGVSSFGHHLRARFSTDHVIAVSDYVKGLLLNSPYQRRHISTIKHGVDTQYFSPVSQVEKARLRSQFFERDVQDKIILGSASGTHEAKGWLDLVHALSLLAPEQRKRFHIAVIGEQPDQLLLAQAAAHGVCAQLSFMGVVEDVRSVLAACDLGFVLSYHEALSYACREKMALGLPVLVTRVGGLPENVSDGCEGWIVPARSPESIKDVLLNILSNPSRLSVMGPQARVRAERDFNLNNFIESTMAVYQMQQPA
jgi:glycosyltransferase involved in cell wall biosynthesis